MKVLGSFMFRFCKREKPSTKTTITLIDTIILINKELSTFTLTVTRFTGHAPTHHGCRAFGNRVALRRELRVLRVPYLQMGIVPLESTFLELSNSNNF
jgi:hypothetical protein